MSSLGGSLASNTRTEALARDQPDSEPYVPPTRSPVSSDGVVATRAQADPPAVPAKGLPKAPLLLGLGAVALAVLWWIALSGDPADDLAEDTPVSDDQIPGQPQSFGAPLAETASGGVASSKTSPLVLVDALGEFLGPLGLSRGSSLDQAVRQLGRPDETASVQGQGGGAQEGYASFLEGEVVVFHDPESKKLLQVDISVPRSGELHLARRAKDARLLGLFEATSSDLERLLGPPQENPERSEFSYALPGDGGKVTLQCYRGSLCSKLQVSSCCWQCSRSLVRRRSLRNHSGSRGTASSNSRRFSSTVAKKLFIPFTPSRSELCS